MKPWHGIGYKFGYKDEFRPDGTWRVVAAVRGGEPVDVAMYRMAERAREAGYPYLQFLGGAWSSSPGYRSATITARPSRSVDQPADCPARDRTSCYTADVATLLRLLGGPGGTQPGVALPDEIDRFGRQVFYSSYGKGAVAAGAILAAPAPPAPRAPISAIVHPTAPSRDPGPTSRDKAIKANQPVHGREPTQGWTISD